MNEEIVDRLECIAETLNEIKESLNANADIVIRANIISEPYKKRDNDDVFDFEEAKGIAQTIFDWANEAGKNGNHIR